MPMNPRLLRPTQNTHPEAANWANRVRTNGGTVSGSTLVAVSRFCRAIDAAGIRDRFYRLNLFCGTGLPACLVPLYRGPSLTGTQYGNTTDTNVNFVGGDYAETGASGGLVGNGSSKHLRTGVSPYNVGLAQTNIHLATYIPSLGVAGGGYIALGAYQLPSELTALSLSPAYGGANLFLRAGGVGNFLNATYSATRLGHVVAQRTGAASAAAYHRGVLMSPASTTFAGDVAWTATDNPGNVAVYARNENGAFWYQGALAGYSLGLSMTGAQVLAYNNVMQTFQAALSRNA